MASIFRSFWLHLHRLRDTKIVTLDGIRVHSSAHWAPQAVRNGLYKKTYEDAERRLLLTDLRDGDRVLEIGAGIGVVGMLAASVTGGGNVLSYEANPALEPVIKANHSLNAAVPDVRFKAITTDGAPVQFHRAPNILSSSIHQRRQTEETITVESDSLADAIAEFAPDVLVMDVEGAEIDLLDGAPLGGIRSIVLELHPHIVGEAAIEKLLAGLEADGFRTAEKDRKTVLLVNSAKRPGPSSNDQSIGR